MWNARPGISSFRKHLRRYGSTICVVSGTSGQRRASVNVLVVASDSLGCIADRGFDGTCFHRIAEDHLTETPHLILRCTNSVTR